MPAKGVGPEQSAFSDGLGGINGAYFIYVCSLWDGGDGADFPGAQPAARLGHGDTYFIGGQFGLLAQPHHHHTSGGQLTEAVYHRYLVRFSLYFALLDKLRDDAVEKPVHGSRFPSRAFHAFKVVHDDGIGFNTGNITYNDLALHSLNLLSAVYLPDNLVQDRSYVPGGINGKMIATDFLHRGFHLLENRPVSF